MADIFHVYASKGRDNYTELDLPVSDYEMLDLMERLRLEPGRPPYAEVRKICEEHSYLRKCICNPVNLYQLNALARKLSEFTSVQDKAVFEGLIRKEIGDKARAIPLFRLIDFAYSTEESPVAADVTTDHQLGKFLVENDFIEEANGLSESTRALLDYEKIGKEHREAEGGVYTGFGYVELHSQPHCVSETMDFQPRKPDHTILVNMAAMPLTGGRIQKEDMFQLRLPASEGEIQAALEKLGRKDLNDVAVSVWDSPLPWLKHTIYFGEELPQLLELAERLQKLDAAGEMPKYKAILEAEDGQSLFLMLSFAEKMDKYLFTPQASSPADVAQEKLKVLMGDEDAETLMPYIDLQGYGRALLERDHAVITEYGLVERAGGEQVQGMEQQPGPGGMEMV